MGMRIHEAFRCGACRRAIKEEASATPMPEDMRDGTYRAGMPAMNQARASSGLTRNHAAYSAGRNSSVSAVATISPPMIATAIGP